MQSWRENVYNRRFPRTQVHPFRPLQKPAGKRSQPRQHEEAFLQLPPSAQEDVPEPPLGPAHGTGGRRDGQQVTEVTIQTDDSNNTHDSDDSDDTNNTNNTDNTIITNNTNNTIDTNNTNNTDDTNDTDSMSFERKFVLNV